VGKRKKEVCRKKSRGEKGEKERKAKWRNGKKKKKE